jgi:hypothetical protein
MFEVLPARGLPVTGRQRMRCRMGHRWWSPVVAGAVAKDGCPRCWHSGESIEQDDKREEWVHDEDLD